MHTGKIKMLLVGYNYQTQVLEQALIYKVNQKAELEGLFSQLSPDEPWGDRKDVAKKLGYMNSQEAVPQLLAVLPSDPFSMVRYAIILALEKIGYPDTISTLYSVAENDGF